MQVPAEGMKEDSLGANADAFQDNPTICFLECQTAAEALAGKAPNNPRQLKVRNTIRHLYTSAILDPLHRICLRPGTRGVCRSFNELRSTRMATFVTRGMEASMRWEDTRCWTWFCIVQIMSHEDDQ